MIEQSKSRKNKFIRNIYLLKLLFYIFLMEHLSIKIIILYFLDSLQSKICNITALPLTIWNIRCVFLKIFSIKFFNLFFAVFPIFSVLFHDGAFKICCFWMRAAEFVKNCVKFFQNLFCFQICFLHVSQFLSCFLRFLQFRSNFFHET